MWKVGGFWVWVFKVFFFFLLYLCQEKSQPLLNWHCSSVPAMTPAQNTLNPGQDLQLFSSCANYLLKSPLQGAEIAWLAWETLPGGLAVAGNDFFCPGSHKPLEAATQRWHFQITVTRLLQSSECQHSCWDSTMPEGPKNGERHSEWRKQFCDLSFIQHQPFLAHSKYLKMRIAVTPLGSQKVNSLMCQPCSKSQG